MIRRSLLHSLLVCMLALAAGYDYATAQQVPRPEQELEKRRVEYEESLKRPKKERNPEDVRGRQEWFDFQRRYPYDQIPAGARVAAIEQARALAARLNEPGKEGTIGRILSER